jgi:hypothetical protein
VKARQLRMPSPLTVMPVEGMYGPASTRWEERSREG